MLDVRKCWNSYYGDQRIQWKGYTGLQASHSFEDLLELEVMEEAGDSVVWFHSGL